MVLPCLTVALSDKKGKGVFTTEIIKTKTIIEISPVLVFPKKDVKNVEKTLLYSYVFEWGTKLKRRALGLGYISLYNHSYDANCEYEMDFDFNTISVIAVRDIKKGEELFINYNAEPNDKTPVWFETN